MTGRLTHRFDALGDESYDYGYDDGYDPRHKPKILWGRVAGLVAIVLVAFLAGRAAAPDGIPQSRYERLRAQLSGLQAENESLRARLAQARVEGSSAGESPSGGSPSPSLGESPGGSPGDSAGGSAASTTYSVQKNDTFSLISEKFYGTSAYWKDIARKNGLSPNATLKPGQELKIPAKP